jgi:predicted site-specific integrase-resolvase
MSEEERPRARRNVNSRTLKERYPVCDRTISRWVQAGILPKPVVINGRRYWNEAELDERDRERIR